MYGLLEINTTPSDSIGVMIILFKVVVRMDKKDLYITQNSYPLARNVYTKPKICYKNPPSRKSCPELFKDNKQMQQILTKNNYSHPPDSYIPMPHAIETECKKLYTSNRTYGQCNSVVASQNATSVTLGAMELACYNLCYLSEHPKIFFLQLIRNSLQILLDNIVYCDCSKVFVQ